MAITRRWHMDPGLFQRVIKINKKSPTSWRFFSMFFGGGGWDRTGTSLTPSGRGYSETKWVAIGSITTHKKIPRMGFNWKMSFGGGGWDRTIDLQIMSLTSYHCSTPRQGTLDSIEKSTKSISEKNGANGWSRTADHRVMSPVLYRWATLAREE